MSHPYSLIYLCAELRAKLKYISLYCRKFFITYLHAKEDHWSKAKQLFGQPLTICFIQIHYQHRGIHFHIFALTTTKKVLFNHRQNVSFVNYGGSLSTLYLCTYHPKSNHINHFHIRFVLAHKIIFYVINKLCLMEEAVTFWGHIIYSSPNSKTCGCALSSPLPSHSSCGFWLITILTCSILFF